MIEGVNFEEVMIVATSITNELEFELELVLLFISSIVNPSIIFLWWYKKTINKTPAKKHLFIYYII